MKHPTTQQVEQTQTPPHAIFDLWREDWEVKDLSPALADLQRRLTPKDTEDKEDEEGPDAFERQGL